LLGLSQKWRPYSFYGGNGGKPSTAPPAQTQTLIIDGATHKSLDRSGGCAFCFIIGPAPLPEQIELHRDRMWRRDEDLRVESALDAERFIEDVGFANTLTDTRRAGPSLYIAVCGRRDVSLPRNVHKDEVMRRDRVYYAKLAGGSAGGCVSVFQGSSLTLGPDG